MMLLSLFTDVASHSLHH